jgi:galactonate dehydratase
MKITKIETLRLERFPLLVWVRVHTDAGFIGLGETFYGARTVEAAIHEIFASLLIGKNPFDIERHWQTMFGLADHWGYGGAETRAISALDTALWDVVGQALDRPIYDLLGGRCRDRICVYDSGGGADYFTDPVPYVRELLDSGITAMKVAAFPEAHGGDSHNLGRADLERILAPIQQITDAFGDAMQIAVDGHGFWGLHAATTLARALDTLPILWLEELISPRNVDAYLKLRQVSSIPVTLSERFVTRYQFREYIERGALDIVMPDLVWTGGISETKRIAVLADTYQLPVCPHDCTGPVNMFACAHICMSIPNAMLMESHRQWYEPPKPTDRPPDRDDDTHGLVNGWYNEVTTPRVRIENGYLHAPEGAGLGVKLRPEVFDRDDARLVVSDKQQSHYLRWEQ